MRILSNRITAGRKEEILKRKQAYDDEMSAYNARQREYAQQYKAAYKAVTDPIKNELESSLSRFSALSFDIEVHENYNSKHPGVDVRIRCNERNKFDEDSALAWSYDVKLNVEGQVIRETSSWSGLKATTEAQLKSLRQTVSALEYLNDLDWESIMNVDMPNYEDYYDLNDKRPVSEDWNAQLQEAELEELVGSNKIVKVKNWGESCPYRGDVWLKIIKETPAMYEVVIIPDYFVQRMQKSAETGEELMNTFSKNIDGSFSSYRVRKSSVHLVSPIEIKEV